MTCTFDETEVGSCDIILDSKHTNDVCVHLQLADEVPDSIVISHTRVQTSPQLDSDSKHSRWKNACVSLHSKKNKSNTNVFYMQMKCLHPHFSTWFAHIQRFKCAVKLSNPRICSYTQKPTRRRERENNKTKQNIYVKLIVLLSDNFIALFHSIWISDRTTAVRPEVTKQNCERWERIILSVYSVHITKEWCRLQLHGTKSIQLNKSLALSLSLSLANVLFCRWGVKYFCDDEGASRC